MATYDHKKQEYQERFRGMNDEQLVDTFNREVGNSGWTSSRASYLSALHEEFENRNFDYSDIGDKKELSLKKRVKLIDKKLVVDVSQGKVNLSAEKPVQKNSNPTSESSPNTKKVRYIQIVGYPRPQEKDQKKRTAH